MSIRNYSNAPSMDVQQVRIVTVDPATARVEGVMKDGAILQIAVWDAPLTFRWPEEGETWRVCRQGIYWVLDGVVIDPKDEKPNSELGPGEAKVDAEFIYDRKGRQVIATDVDTASEGEMVIRRDDGWNTEPLPTPYSVEAWRVFGQPGQPALQSGWAQNNFASAQTARFRKDTLNQVYFQGMLRTTNGGVAGHAFTLPAGYIPLQTLYAMSKYWASGSSSWFIADVIIDGLSEASPGRVRIFNLNDTVIGGGSDYVPLNGISFFVD